MRIASIVGVAMAGTLITASMVHAEVPAQSPTMPLFVPKKIRKANLKPGVWVYPTTRYQFSARFRQRGGWSLGYHTGLDFAAPTGRPVYAAYTGKVIQATWAGPYGNCVQIKHPSGKVTLYAHLSRVGTRKGQRVRTGEMIGKVGNTGRSFGSHLHFEVKRSKGFHSFMDPLHHIHHKH